MIFIRKCGPKWKDILWIIPLKTLPRFKELYGTQRSRICKRVGSRTAYRQGALVQKHLSQLLRHFSFCWLLPQALWTDTWVRQCQRVLVGAASGGAALLRALLLRAGDAGDADRPQSLRSGLFD